MSMRCTMSDTDQDAMELCGMDRSPLPKHPVVAMAYVPFQQFNPKNLYSAEDGFNQGTLFPDLDKPFTGWPGGWK